MCKAMYDIKNLAAEVDRDQGSGNPSRGVTEQCLSPYRDGLEAKPRVLIVLHPLDVNICSLRAGHGLIVDTVYFNCKDGSIIGRGLSDR